MKVKSLYPLALGALFIVGCQGGVQSPGTTPPPLAGNPTKDPVVPPKDAVAPPQDKQTPPPPVPEELKSDGYHWYGLANDKPVSFKISTSTGSQSFDGTMTMHLMSVEGGKATYEIERTGGLGDQLGTDTVVLDKDGIRITNSTKYKTKAPILDMPAMVPVGATWENDGTLEMDGDKEFTQAMKFKVVGEQSITTKVGKRQALLVTAKGDVSFAGSKFRMEESQWYVKDRGLVKSELRMFDVKKPKAPPQVITIQETSK